MFQKLSLTALESYSVVNENVNRGHRNSIIEQRLVRSQWNYRQSTFISIIIAVHLSWSVVFIIVCTHWSDDLICIYTTNPWFTCFFWELLLCGRLMYVENVQKPSNSENKNCFSWPAYVAVFVWTLAITVALYEPYEQWSVVNPPVACSLTVLLLVLVREIFVCRYRRHY